MKKWDSRADVRLTADVDTKSRLEKEAESEDHPFLIVVLGDFRGTSAGAPSRQAGALQSRRLQIIDRDDFNEALARFDVAWEGMLRGLPNRPESGVRVRVVFREIDDFHPDRIVEQVEPLRLLLKTRRALEDPSRFDSVASEVMKWVEPVSRPEPEPAKQSQVPVKPPHVRPGELLDLILGAPESQPAKPSKDTWSADLRDLVQDAVRPHLVRVDTARQGELVEAVDKALAQAVRSILQDPLFKQLEATWRSLHWLVGVAETGTDLKVAVVQAAKEELVQDMSEHQSLEQAGLARLLLEPASVPGGERPALLVGNYEFSNDLEDLALLERIGGIAQRLRAPFVAAASPALLGLESFTEISSPVDFEDRLKRLTGGAWQALRHSPQARWLALALPRVLSRLPYGRETDEVQSFQFEEIIDGSNHEQLLWGSPAFRVAAVVAGAFAEQGWSLDLSRGVARLESLPLYVYRVEGETVSKPCAEVLMQEQVVEALEEAGFIPLVSYRNTDRVVLPCIQSLGLPRRPLLWEG